MSYDLIGKKGNHSSGGKSTFAKTAPMSHGKETGIKGIIRRKSVFVMIAALAMFSGGIHGIGLVVALS